MSHEQHAKVVVIKFFFRNFNNFISRFERLCETPLAQFFKFLDSKNNNANNKNYRKKLLHIQKTNIKNFCDTPLIIGKRCPIIFHFSAIIFRNANTTYSNEQNLIVFSRVFWKYFFGIPDTENTPAQVQKCFLKRTNTKKWVSGHNTQSHNTQCQNTQCQYNQCHNTQCDI